MPSEQWAKLHAKLAESVDFADLYEASPEAALLFLMSLPQAVPWGVLPGDPRLFGRRVCGMLGLSAEKIKTSLRLIVDSGMYRSYTDEEGRQLLYVTHWNENQQRQWGRCGLPEFKLPPDWTPPEGISNELATAKAKGRGLTAEALAECVVSDESKTQSKTALSLSLANGYLKRSREVESPEERQRQHPSAPPANAGDAPPARKRTTKTTDEDPAATLEAVKGQFPEGTLTAAADFVTLRRAHRAGGRIQAGALVTLYRELLAVATEDGMTPEAFAYGVSCAVQNDADNVNYAAKAARNYKPTGTVTRLQSGSSQQLDALPAAARVSVHEHLAAERARIAAQTPRMTDEERQAAAARVVALYREGALTSDEAGDAE